MEKSENKKPIKITILGSDYTVFFRKENDDEKLKRMDGYIDTSERFIVVAEFEKNENSVSDLAAYQKEVLRHGIIHAFLRESGLWANSNPTEAWAQSEEMTDWFAIQSPKIFEVFRDLELI